MHFKIMFINIADKPAGIAEIHTAISESGAGITYSAKFFGAG